MNQFNAFAHKARLGFHAYVRVDRDGSAKPIMEKGGQPSVFDDELSALRAAVQHLLRYINGHFVRDGEIAPAVVTADAHFKPELRRAEARRKHGKARRAPAQ